jgi:hypothetical protein
LGWGIGLMEDYGWLGFVWFDEGLVDRDYGWLGLVWFDEGWLIRDYGLDWVCLV